MTNKIISLLALSAFATSAFADHHGEKAAIVVEFPPPFLIGTPVQVNLPHLEDAGAPAPVIMAPKGTINIAKDKEVTSSDDFPIIGDLSYATDGDKESEEGYFVELAPGLQWIQVDLEKSSTVYGVSMWHFHTQKRAYNDVILQISDDEAFKTGVTTVFNNDHDNSSGLGKGADKAYLETNKGKLIDARGIKGQYVRLYSAGNTSNEMNHVVEVEVYGTN
ncbi:MAG: hypothetical protein HN457_00845 [Opitutales bacterium]|jgi:hypothetical protein|nr:hypothetical protein [Opitutales bacterium]MBT5168596.1 hypothetical protein [Opitutales bacterium]MBT5815714.1 hypothetical protein [Opitutales bacterium]MBT6380653.1 hypothetical protein [Opitutales bacterium]MBT6770245.1 hypothetical protein [Opitutales bacterium]